MRENLKIMFVMAHPDDESLGVGGLVARCADEGIDVFLITATRGEHGWPGDPDQYPGPQELGALRQEELHQAAQILGVRFGAFLDYIDGELSNVDHAEAARKIAEYIRKLRPDVVVTFDPFGVYGHPDHIAISQFTHAGVLLAASAEDLQENDDKPHRISKFYYLAEPEDNLHHYQQVFGQLSIQVNGEERHPVGWKPWAVTTWIDVSAYQEQVKQAIKCHRTQFPETLIERLFDSNLFSQTTLYRVFSFVNGGQGTEKDIFAGLR
jgi:LmbE family N-acetylglucosaminyl deacetylase